MRPSQLAPRSSPPAASGGVPAGVVRRRGGGRGRHRLGLAGAATAAAFTSLVSAILLPRINVMNEFRCWQIGGVGGATFASISLVLPVGRHHTATAVEDYAEL